ncbi:MAG: sarcosine oxidase subunit gamma family protein [Pseudomonadota bacterium]
MANLTLKATPRLGGRNHRVGDNRIVERSDIALHAIGFATEEKPAIEGALVEVFGIAWPTSKVATCAGEARALFLSPDQLLLVREGVDLDQRHSLPKFEAVGYPTNQSDVWVVCEVMGPDVLAALERMCAVDLDPAVFSLGSYARTLMMHLSVIIVRHADDGFLLICPSAAAESFWHDIVLSFEWVQP